MKTIKLTKIASGFYEYKTQTRTYTIESGDRAELENTKEWLVSWEKDGEVVPSLAEARLLIGDMEKSDMEMIASQLCK